MLYLDKFAERTQLLFMSSERVSWLCKLKKKNCDHVSSAQFEEFYDFREQKRE